MNQGEVNTSASTRPLFWSQDYWNLVDTNHTLASSTFLNEPLSIFFSQSENEIRVPGSATFGGWWPTTGTRPETAQFVEAYRRLFDLYPQHTFQLRLPPEYFYPEVFLPQAEALRIIGASETVDTVQIFPITSDLAKDVVSSLPKGERWWVRKFQKEGGQVRHASQEELENAYEIVRQNKERRGATISISLEKFLNLVQKDPRSYRCWLATLDDEFLGSALTVDLDPKTTYVFYWADTLGGRKKSVVTSIFAAILEDARIREKSVLDLGLSSVEGVIDNGLFSFKRHLGARCVKQSSFQLKLF